MDSWNGHRWKLPGRMRPFDLLSPLDGYEPENFDLITGDYRRRFSNTAERIMHYLEEHYALMGEYDAESITNFVITTYFREIFDYMPRLIIRGASDCGKSKLLTCLENLCYRGFRDADITGPALFRLIEREHITPLLDELQDYKQDQRDTIRTVFKNGIYKGGHVSRSIKRADDDYDVITYALYAPMAIVNQSGGIIDETEANRSITIKMMKSCRRLPMRENEDELQAIRTELYTLRMLWLNDRTEKILDGLLRGSFEETIDDLESEKDLISGITGEPVRIRNRARDMAGTLMTVAKLTSTTDAILETLRDQQAKTSASEGDGEDSRSFHALLRCMMVPERMNDVILHRNYYAAAAQISTREIAGTYNDLMAEDGEGTPHQRVPTRTVTNRLIDLGFAVDGKRMRDNLSRLAQRDFENVFRGNLVRFGTDEEKSAMEALIPDGL